MSVQYTIIGKSGKRFEVDDFCFRGLFINTQRWIPNQADWVNCDDTMPEDQAWDEVKNNPQTVIYYTRVTDIMREVAEALPWIKGHCKIEDDQITLDATVLKGDHLFHILSCMRNLQDNFASTYDHFRKTNEPYDAMFMSFMLVHSEDWEGNDRTYRMRGNEDYMFANTETLTTQDVEMLYKDGPQFRLPVGLPFNCTCHEVEFKPFINDEYSENHYFMYYAFQRDRRELSEEMADDKFHTASTAKVKKILKGIVKGKQ